MYLPTDGPFAPATFAYLFRRVEALETALDAVFDALLRLADELPASAGGPTADALRGLNVREIDQASAAGIAEIDALLTAGKKPTAVRRYRDLTGTTWDQAHQAVAVWSESPAKWRQETVRLIVEQRRLAALRAFAARR
jgi:hypothetical protein